MKNFILLIPVIFIISISCDGRKTKKEALDKAVSDFNLKVSPMALATFHPENYVEVVTDTLISNKIKVRIKNYSLLDEQILISKTSTQNPEKATYQRIFASEISISTATKDILNTHITAKQFKSIDNDPFWNDATLQHAWVNEELSNTHSAHVDISFLNPKTKASKIYRMVVGIDGKQELFLIEENS